MSLSPAEARLRATIASHTIVGEDTKTAPPAPPTAAPHSTRNSWTRPAATQYAPNISVKPITPGWR